MDSLKVLVASHNKIKALSTKDAFSLYTNQKVQIAKSNQPVNSGVADQPLTLSESAKGALNRLKLILDTPGYDYYVAIEGGVYKVSTPLGVKWFEAACAVVSDGKKQSIAYGPGYPVPKIFIEHIKEGKDLTEAMEHETGIRDIGKAGGFNGWLTEEKSDRRKGSAEAILLALYGLRHE